MFAPGSLGGRVDVKMHIRTRRELGADLPVLVWRLLDEERILQRDLPGYTEYMRRVRARLVPFVW
jgi:protein-S-isoprenylcysteine O-methyltransferase Ste14